MGENSNDWHIVMGKMEKHCIGEVNENYKRHCFNLRDKFPTESDDIFVAELRNLAKTFNFCYRLRGSFIRDRIVHAIKNEQTAKKLLGMRGLTQSRCIDVCRSEVVDELQMKSLSGPVDNINQVKSSTKKPRAPTPDMRSAKKISCKFCGYNHQPDRKICPVRGKKCKRCHFAKKCEKVLVHNIESDKELEEISVVRVQALRGRAVYARMLPKLVTLHL